MIKVTVNELLEAQPVLNKITYTEMRAALSFRIMRAIKALDEIVKDVRDSYNQLIEKYAERDSDGNIVTVEKGIKIQEEFLTAFNNEYDALMATEIEVGMEPMPVEVLDHVEVTPYQAIMLDKFFEQ